MMKYDTGSAQYSVRSPGSCCSRHDSRAYMLISGPPPAAADACAGAPAAPAVLPGCGGGASHILRAGSGAAAARLRFGNHGAVRGKGGTAQGITASSEVYTCPCCVQGHHP